MKQAIISETGVPSEVLQIQEVSEPTAGPGEVLVRLTASPVNPADLNYIQGTYGKKPVLPAVPGIEGAGVVTAVGEGVSGFQPGQAVLPLAGPGFWTESRVFPAADLVPLPDGIDPFQAAMLRVNPATAWGLLHADGPPAPGSWVVQNAGSSAAGHCVIRLARALGLRTLSLVRRPESIADCLAAGGDAALVDSADSQDEARRILSDGPPSLALNAVGGDSSLRLMDLLAPGGVMVTYGAMSLKSIKVPNGFLIFKGVRLQGFWLNRWAESLPAAELHALYTKLAAMNLPQTIAAVFPLDEIRQAVTRAAEAGRGGKVLVELR